MSERLPILANVLPLRGRQLIEASAGTGKTWTLAALYVRLVIGHGRGGLSQGLLPPQILVMTFTEAATAELRDRIRERLRQAAAAFALPLNTPPADDFLAALVQDTPESERAACAEQLSRAVSWMDESAIHTIHGWCSRTLRQHAFDSVSLFEQEHVEDRKALLQDIAELTGAQVVAEELGITSKNIDEALKSEKPAIKRFVGTAGAVSKNAQLGNATPIHAARIACAIFGLCALGNRPATGVDWPQFLGPNRDGTTAALRGAENFRFFADRAPAAANGQSLPTDAHRCLSTDIDELLDHTHIILHFLSRNMNAQDARIKTSQLRARVASDLY